MKTRNKCYGALILAALCLFYVEKSYAIECSINGVQAVKLAQSYGFTSFVSKTKLNGEEAKGGSCKLKGANLIMSGMKDSDIECRVSFFRSRKFHKDWSLISLKFSGIEFEYEVDPSWNSSDPEVNILVSVPKNAAQSLTLKTMILGGPDCSKLEEAFKQSETK